MVGHEASNLINLFDLWKRWREKRYMTELVLATFEACHVNSNPASVAKSVPLLVFNEGEE